MASNKINNDDFGVYAERNSEWAAIAEEESTSAGGTAMGSTANTFSRLRETAAQQAIERGEPPPEGFFPPEFPSSTRVAGYRFVPNNPNETSDSALGTLFVRFIKYDTAWSYQNIPKSVYDSFNTPGVSKGRFINTTLNPLSNHGSKAASSDMLYFNGF